MPTASMPLLTHVQVTAHELRDALGPTGQPATFTFTATGLTITTPAGSVRIATQVISRSVSGNHTAGLRPSDADRLRVACLTDTPEAELRVRARTVTLTTAGTAVTVGRW